MARLQQLTFNRNSSRLLLVVALVAGIVASVLVFIALQGSDDNASVTPGTADTVRVVVASQDIAPGTEVKEGMLKVIDVPAELRIGGAFAATTPVVGEVTSVAVAEGEQFTDAKLGLAVPDKGLSGVLQPGMRGFSIEVDEVTAVGGNLLPGDRVDVVVAYKVHRGPELQLADDEYILRTQTILQDIEVISVAQEAQKPSAHADIESGDAAYTSGLVPDNVDDQPDANSITLSVTPEQAQELNAWRESEATQQVSLVLRAFGEDGSADLEPVDLLIVED